MLFKKGLCEDNTYFHRFGDIAFRMQVAIITHPAGFSELKGSIFSEKLKKCLAFVEIL